MSDESAQKVDEAVARIDRLIKFAYAVGSFMFLLSAWVTKQEFEDRYQWDEIRRMQQGAQSRAIWQIDTSDQLTRMDERMKSLDVRTGEIKRDIERIRESVVGR